MPPIAFRYGFGVRQLHFALNLAIELPLVPDPESRDSRIGKCSGASMMKTFPAIALVLLLGAGCSPSPQSTSDNNRSADRLQAVQHPDKAVVSPEQVASDIVGRVVRVSDLSGNADPTEWTFESKEFRHVDILESKTLGNIQTVVVFVTTRNNPVADEEQVQVSGKLQLVYERKGSKWVLTKIQNVNFRYSVGVAT